jgi:hypothetical protein
LAVEPLNREPPRPGPVFPIPRRWREYVDGLSRAFFLRSPPHPGFGGRGSGGAGAGVGVRRRKCQRRSAAPSTYFPNQPCRAE